MQPDNAAPVTAKTAGSSSRYNRNSLIKGSHTWFHGPRRGAFNLFVRVAPSIRKVLGEAAGRHQYHVESEIQRCELRPAGEERRGGVANPVALVSKDGFGCRRGIGARLDLDEGQ